MSRSYAIELPRDPIAPTIARMNLARWLGEDVDPDLLASAKLLATELVTNAYVHGDGQITLEADMDGDRIRVAVIDDGGGFEHQIRDQGLDSLGGWGLEIVEQESSRWGVHEGTTHVWFELELPGPRLGAEAASG